MSETSIEWTDKTWNPVRGCSIVSAGCKHCYAMKMAHRFSGTGKPYEGLTQLSKAGPVWTGAARFVPGMLAAPLTWRKPQRVFVNSMSDLFHYDITREEIAAVFAVMLLSPRHTYQVLTKRPERMLDVLSDRYFYEYVLDAAGAIRTNRPELCSVGISDPTTFPAPWIWLGVSCENQAAADERIPLLLQTPTAVRFVSAEPLLGPIDFTRFDAYRRQGFGHVNWVIAGGESGPGARPCDLAWIRSIVRQSENAGVPVFVKQLGARTIGEWGDNPQTYRVEISHSNGGVWQMHDRKGGDPSEWPADLRVRKFPVSDLQTKSTTNQHEGGKWREQ